jgi:hypothetical protein
MAAVLGPDLDIAKPSREVEHRQIRLQHFGRISLGEDGLVALVSAK